MLPWRLMRLSQDLRSWWIPYQENFVEEKFHHLARISSLFPDKIFYPCFRSLSFELKNSKFKINLFILISINCNQNIFSLHRLSCCLATGSPAVVWFFNWVINTLFCKCFDVRINFKIIFSFVTSSQFHCWYADRLSSQLSSRIAPGNLKVSLKLSDLTLSWWRSFSYRNQSIDLLLKSMAWFLYERVFRRESSLKKKHRNTFQKIFWRVVIYMRSLGQF